MPGNSCLQSMGVLSRQDQDHESIDFAEFWALHYPLFRAVAGGRDPEAEQIVLTATPKETKYLTNIAWSASSSTHAP